MTVLESLGGAMLRQGSTGPAVQVMQLALRTLGYGLKADTQYFGPATDVAVRQFQRRAGLYPVDGVVGPKTAAALDKAVAEMPNVPEPKKAPVLIAVQRPLWLQAGELLVGTQERVGGHDNEVIIEWAHEEGGSIARDYKTTSTAWCSLFLNHCVTRAGLPGTETLWALDWNADLMKQRLGHGWPGVRLPGLVVGGIAPMKRPGGGHVAIVVGRSASGNVVCLGGNQQDQVSYRSFPQGRLDQGIWWPASVPLPTQIGFDLLPLVTGSGKLSTNEA